MATRIGMPVGATPLLRRIREADLDPPLPPRVLGVDDWAWRKGQRYGTILVDLESGEAIDLLPSRDADALKQWLLDLPDVEVISRDRATAYAQAASEAAPEAAQVADRWHLLKNVREMLERFFEHHRGQIKAVASQLAQPLAPQRPASETPQAEEAKQDAETAAPATPGEPTPKAR